MGGLNCGMSNDRHKGTSNFVKQYADITQNIFKVLASISNANVSIEDLVMQETENSETSLAKRDIAIKLLSQAESQLDDVQNNINLGISMLEPVFRQPELKDGFVKPYMKKNHQKSYDFWLKHGLINNNLNEYTKIVELLKDNGEIGYLGYLDKLTRSLQTTIRNLREEYASTSARNQIANGTFQLAIRDAENQVTALTAQSFTQMSLITSALTTYCLVEYSSQTSVSGKKPSFDSFTVSSKSSSELEDDEI